MDSQQATFEVSPLDILASAAANIENSLTSSTPGGSAIEKRLSMDFDRFYSYLRKQPVETARGIYNKAYVLLHTPGHISKAPGLDAQSRMVSSVTNKKRPHLVSKGRSKGEFRCERSCLHFNGLKICSHIVATAEDNDSLAELLIWYEKNNLSANLTKIIRTDMPDYPGKKGSTTAKSKTVRLPIEERVSRIPNNNSFFVKPMSNLIKVCQGCRGSLRTAEDTIPSPPHNFCIARKELRKYKDAHTGIMKTSSHWSDSHYHLHKDCILAVEPAFHFTYLIIGESIPQDIKSYITNSF